MYYLYVAIFGAFGSAARYWVGSTLGAGAGAGAFPFSTLLINLAGCFLLAVTVKYLATFPNLSKNFINGIGTGFIGSFTTFSTFSAETFTLMAGGYFLTASGYIFASLVGGFLSAALGFRLSSMLLRRKERAENGN